MGADVLDETGKTDGCGPPIVVHNTEFCTASPQTDPTWFPTETVQFDGR